MIDTHCHLTFDHYAGRVEQVIAHAVAAGVRGMITVSTTPADCARAQQLAEAHDRVWFSAGHHPLHSDEPRDWPALRAAAAGERCAAFGELGLDHHYERPPRPLQHEVLQEQLAMIEAAAQDGLVKPIIVHCRDAFDDLIAVLRRTSLDPSRFVFHCFTGTPDNARTVLDFGAWISFTGVVTFRNAPEVAEAARLVPAESIMAETDAPFLSPEPVRHQRPNEPKNVVHIARFLAKLRGVDEREFEAQLDANAERFFGITLPPL